MAITVRSGRQVVTTAGTAVALGAADNFLESVTIQAETDNTGIVAIGNSGVIAALATRQGVGLAAGESFTINCQEQDLNLKSIYIDSVVNGDGVTWTGFAS